jgi:hypothetical protein
MGMTMLKEQIPGSTPIVTEACVDCARSNWWNWQDVFEHDGAAVDNPLLVDPARFNKFLGEYSVRRTIRKGTWDDLRKRLRSSELTTLLEDDTGATVDKQESLLREDFGTLDKLQRPKKVLSALSKIAAFLAPHVFIAWDSSATRGLKKCGRKFDNYADYLREAKDLLAGPLGKAVCEACRGRYPTIYAEAKPDGFHRRVLDQYLMRLGGRDLNP